MKKIIQRKYIDSKELEILDSYCSRMRSLIDEVDEILKENKVFFLKDFSINLVERLSSNVKYERLSEEVQNDYVKILDDMTVFLKNIINDLS